MTTAPDYKKLSIEDVQLDYENPRIKHFLEYFPDKSALTAEQIANALADPGGGDSSASYTTLKESIKISRGIVHPIIVNKQSDGIQVVIEGNTRLQIYKEFYSDSQDAIWATIPSLVYDNLSPKEIESIRLQSHLVGPRAWDLYSKAKYLNDLSNVQYMSLTEIISMCGEDKNGIVKLINAFKIYQKYYIKAAESRGDDHEPRNFSKFVEFQNNSVVSAVRGAGFTEETFADWVADGKIDTAQNVRKLPAVLNNKEAKKVFLSKNKTISDAIKIIAAQETGSSKEFDNLPYDVLGKKFDSALQDIKFTEILKLKSDKDYEGKRLILESVYDTLKMYIDAINSEE